MPSRPAFDPVSTGGEEKTARKGGDLFIVLAPDKLGLSKRKEKPS